MKSIHFFILLSTILIALGCSGLKRTPHPNSSYTPEMQKALTNYPEIVGFERKAIFLSEPEKDDEEKDMKIEIVPGRNMLVDCNAFGIQGQILAKEFESGFPYYLFNSNGGVYSTKMGCPDDGKTTKFVTSKTVMVDYNSEHPIVVYTSPHFEVKYCLWKAGKMQQSSIAKQNANPDAIANLNYFSDRAGYVRKVILLEKLSYEDELNRKIEIIPGIYKVVDCNHHSLIGKLTEKVLEGFGFNYFMFDTKGEVISTLMACPDDETERKYVYADTQFLPYQSAMPIVVYLPKGIELQYRVWSTNGKMY